MRVADEEQKRKHRFVFIYTLPEPAAGWEEPDGGPVPFGEFVSSESARK